MYMKRTSGSFHILSVLRLSHVGLSLPSSHYPIQVVQRLYSKSTSSMFRIPKILVGFKVIWEAQNLGTTEEMRGVLRSALYCSTTHG
ncbi:hypothetical protein GGR51DRAFT_543779 [Nemania sp. FL0031]|nr:hypothetical protein GGR51DRAFT_543779 [Nemania sp. FL0031]